MKRIHMLDVDGDGAICFEDDGPDYTGAKVSLVDETATEIEAVLNKSQLLAWCLTVAHQLKSQGVEPSSHDVTEEDV